MHKENNGEDGGEGRTNRDKYTLPRTPFVFRRAFRVASGLMALPGSANPTHGALRQALAIPTSGPKFPQGSKNSTTGRTSTGIPATQKRHFAAPSGVPLHFQDEGFENAAYLPHLAHALQGGEGRLFFLGTLEEKRKVGMYPTAFSSSFPFVLVVEHRLPGPL